MAMTAARRTIVSVNPSCEPVKFADAPLQSHNEALPGTNAPLRYRKKSACLTERPNLAHRSRPMMVQTSLSVHRVPASWQRLGGWARTCRLGGRDQWPKGRADTYDLRTISKPMLVLSR